MVRILFICHGNICRIPMAEFVFKDILEKSGKSDEFYKENCDFIIINNGSLETLNLSVDEILRKIGIK